MTATPIEPGVPLGPGSLHIGLTGTLLDVSCNINSCTIAAEKTEGDSSTKLCGTVVPGAVSYSYGMAGNVDTDIGLATGFFALSQDHAGESVDFEYTPNTGAVTKAVGTLIIDPLDFGGDETGATMTSDFDFTIVGTPTYTYGIVTGLAARETESVA